MPEKVKRLGLQRDYKNFIYFLDREGSVWRAAKPQVGQKAPKDAARELMVPRAITRDNQYLYFIDRDGDIARSPRVGRRRAA